MKIRELVKRLEKIESSLDKCDDTIHSKVVGDWENYSVSEGDPEAK